MNLRPLANVNSRTWRSRVSSPVLRCGVATALVVGAVRDGLVARGAAATGTASVSAAARATRAPLAAASEDRCCMDAPGDRSKRWLESMGDYRTRPRPGQHPRGGRSGGGNARPPFDKLAPQPGP